MRSRSAFWETAPPLSLTFTNVEMPQWHLNVIGKLESRCPRTKTAQFTQFGLIRLFFALALLCPSATTALCGKASGTIDAKTGIAESVGIAYDVHRS
jgi:hypothetical protein